MVRQHHALPASLGQPSDSWRGRRYAIREASFDLMLQVRERLEAQTNNAAASLPEHSCPSARGAHWHVMAHHGT